MAALVGLLLASQDGSPRPVHGLVAIMDSSATGDDLFPFVFCAGVAVGPYKVLTAAHCVTGREPSALAVQVDADNLCRDAPIDGHRVDVAGIDIDPGYEPATAAHDVAVLTLSDPVNSSVRQLGARTGDGVAEAVGWGRGSFAGIPPCRSVLAKLEVLDEGTCAAAITPGPGYRFLGDSMICARPVAGSRDTCGGDSGGPLFDHDATAGVVIGIVSWGRGCGAGAPGVYARADSPWLVGVLGAGR